MNPRRITLLDIGLDSDFDTAMSLIQSTLQSINVDYEEPICEIDFVRSRDPRTVASAFTSQCHVLHVMAHGDHTVTPTFSSSDEKTVVELAELGRWTAGSLRAGISTGAVLADGCKTGTGAWQRAVRDCLQGPITYIGTSATVFWHDGTVFCTAFYGALFRNMGKGRTPAEQAWDAAERAATAYTHITGRKCPYAPRRLEPSASARRALACAPPAGNQAIG